MQVIVLHPYTKFEVRRLSRSEDNTENEDMITGHGGKRPGDHDL